MALVFLPDRREFFLWGEVASASAPGGVAWGRGRAAEVELVTPGRARRIAGTALPLLDTVARLSSVPAADMDALSASVAAWALASKLALDLVSRERVVPTVVQRGGRAEARWAAALGAPADAAQVGALARSLPPSAHAAPAPGAARRAVWAPDALVREFLDATVNAVVREASAETGAAGGRSPAGRGRGPGARWEERWMAALSSGDGTFEARGFGERTLLDDLRAWSEPARGSRDRLRACFRLELPAGDRDPFVLRFLLQSPDDPSLLVTASEVWSARGRTLARLGRAFRDPQESLLEALGRAARLHQPIAASLAEPKPEALALDAAGAWAFLGQGAEALSGAGFGVIVPAELTRAGQRRLRLRMRVGGGTRVAGAVTGAAALGLEELLSFEWQAALGDDALSARDLKALARYKAPLVRHRGQWVAIDPRELREVERRLAERKGQMSAGQAIVAALAGEAQVDDMTVSVTAAGAFGRRLEKLRTAAAHDGAAPRGFRGALRPYQARGLGWLETMAELGLGACLADDMGLGKTVQLLAFLLGRRERAPRDARPALLVAPTSVLGNWEREAGRFAPALRVVRHDGGDRARTAGDVPRGSGTLLVTSYGILRRDAALLSEVDWSTVALDEAQNIKNAASATARAARALRASHRFALTGTPVENRLAELWSIFEFANPGLLGPLERFRREVAVPVERYGDEGVAARLRGIAGPFLLRRLKSDPAVISDLPPKNQMKVICTLTREQATLYQAVVDEEMRRIESAEGMERRGRVLALLGFLKQICNHPAQYLGEAGPLARRSGKLDRVTEMLEEAVAEGDKALVFTQFREMGDRLVAHLAERLGVEVVFLHGGTPRRARDAMVRRFQEEPRGPRVFVLSLRAGGTGLNLTAASHVFHFDRWWNPAVEDQATDRAYRIGQKRAVQVHTLVCAGTVEDKVDAMLEQKRGLAAKVVGTGERWITELGDGALRDLFALSAGAAVEGGDGDGEAWRRRAVSRWGSWGEFPRARKKPPPADGIKMNKSGTTWWGKRWVAALEELSPEYGSRLGRGRTYARAGRTHDLVVSAGRVTARVTGSRATPYQVTLTLKELPDGAWDRAIAAMASKAAFAAELLAGRMPEDIDDAFRGARVSLFPASERDLRTACSCPDWANPCKHVAATHYVLGEALDRDPFLLFELRGRTKQQVLAALRAARGAEAGAQARGQGHEHAHEHAHEHQQGRGRGDGRKPAEEAAPAVSLARVKAADYDRPPAPLPALRFSFEAPAISGQAVRQLGEPPGWHAAAPPADLFGPIIRAAAERARRLAMAEPEPAPAPPPGPAVPAAPAPPIKAARAARGGSATGRRGSGRGSRPRR